MKWTLSAEAGIFFKTRGWVELEIPHEELFKEFQTGQDIWRNSPTLKQFFLKKLAPVALALSGKKKIRIGVDRLFTTENQPANPGPIKEQFCIQGFALGVAIAKMPKVLTRHQELGIIPTPSNGMAILFFRPDVILDWPHLDSDVYIMMYAFDSAVYIHNPKDPHASALKAFGYNFGDTLKNDAHPEIMQ